MPNIQQLSELPDNILIKNLEALVVTENETSVTILLHLAEVDSRKLYLPLGFSSLFAYSRSKLKYAETAALKRIACARVVVKFPKLIDLLLSKELNLTNLSTMAGILTEGNLDEVLKACVGRSGREGKEYISRFKPVAEVKERVRPITIAVKSNEPKEEQEPDLFSVAASILTPEIAASKSGKQSEVRQPELISSAVHATPLATPLATIEAETRYELRFAVKKETYQALEEAKIILSGKYPRGVKLEEVLQEALEEFLDKRSAKRRAARREKRKLAQLSKETKVEVELPAAAAKPQEIVPSAQTTPDVPSRHIPQAVQDQVLNRADFQCEFVSNSGVRCTARHDLELHHLTPFARGSGHSAAEIEIRCRPHNLYEACLDFGNEFMQAKIHGSKLKLLDNFS
jgi:hypothetical protein